MKLWGIDLGGTKIECAVIEEGKAIVRRRLPTEAEKGYEHIIRQIKKLVDEVSAEIGEKPEKIGFATPGVRHPETGLMRNCNTVCFNGKPLGKDLEKTLRVAIKLANDANCFALAEATLGAGANFPNYNLMFGVIMGTGVGGGLVVKDRIVAGLHGIAGEWGHNTLEENGTPCYCGKRGCVETVISGPALENFYAGISRRRLTLKEILENYTSGADEYAAETVERLLEFYGRAIASVINVLDPDFIVIGGGVGNIDLLYTEGYERVKHYVFNQNELRTPILKPVLGDSAGVFGAALLR